MRLTKTVGLLAGTTALTLSGVCFGNTDEANTDALAQIAELKAELAAMKAQNGENWLTEQRADQIRGIVQDVLADSETRSSLQSSGATAGYDNGFFISSADGNFSMKINGLVQFRWIFNGSTGGGGTSGVTGGDYHDSWGFDVRRARVDFSGSMGQTWRYMLQLQYGSPFGYLGNGGVLPVVGPGAAAGGGIRPNLIGATGGAGNVNVLDAYVERDVELGGTEFSLRGGQFKAPFMREWLIDPGDLTTVDYSLLTYYFYQGYSTGLQLGYESDTLRAAFAFTNGLNTPAQIYGLGSYDTSWTSNPTRYSFAGRVEYKMSGNWADFDDLNSRPGTEAGVMVGVAGFYQAYNDNYTSLLAANTNVGGLTADVTWNFGGASLFASLVWENASRAAGGTTNPWGFNVQGGYFLNDDMEVFARYDYANADTTGAEATKLSVITLGMNYFVSTNARFTVDFGWSFNDVGNLFGSAPSTGFAPASLIGSQYAIRTQLQLSF